MRDRVAWTSLAEEFVNIRIEIFFIVYCIVDIWLGIHISCFAKEEWCRWMCVAAMRSSRYQRQTRHYAGKKSEISFLCRQMSMESTWSRPWNWRVLSSLLKSKAKSSKCEIFSVSSENSMKVIIFQSCGLEFATMWHESRSEEKKMAGLMADR